MRLRSPRRRSSQPNPLYASPHRSELSELKVGGGWRKRFVQHM